MHLSPSLLHAVVEFKVDDARKDPTMVASFDVPMRREQIPLSALEELLGAMVQATEEILGYSESRRTWSQRSC